MAIKKRTYKGNAIFIHGRAGDPYFEGISSDSTNDPLEEILERQPGVMFDIGANVGLTTALASLAGWSVTAFEPAPSAYPCLLQTIESSGLREVKAIQMALGAREGTVPFFDHPGSASVSHISDSSEMAEHSSQTVPITTLDHFVDKNSVEKIDLIKIDVEGFEIDVLEGAQRTISSMRPSVYVEFNSFTMIAWKNMSPRGLLDFLTAHFPFVYMFEGTRPVLLQDDEARKNFVHRNLIHHGCIDDLYCSFNEIRTTIAS